MSVRQAGQIIDDAQLEAAWRAGSTKRHRQQYAWWTADVQPKDKLTCRLYPQLAFFFDGTGNNLYQELAKPPEKRALSNVARLSQAAIDDPKWQEAFRRYYPGVGTPFQYRSRNGPVLEDKGGKLGLGFGAGGEIRLTAALHEVKKILDSDYGPGAQRHMQWVDVAVFGFSRGATLARAFVRRLIAEQCELAADGSLLWRGYFGERVPLRIRFMGLFDTVASVGGPGLHLDWADALAIPPQVERCLHLVSAHEVRRAFPLDSVRVGRSYPANCEEVVYPGVHADVGGGYVPGFQGRDNALARLPLREMYAEALKAGVMLERYEKLPKEVRSELTLPADTLLSRLYPAYMAALPPADLQLEALLRAHRQLQFRWRGSITRQQHDRQVLGRLYRQVDATVCRAVPANAPRAPCPPTSWQYELPAEPTAQAQQLLGEHRRLVQQIPMLRNPVQQQGRERVARPRTDYEELIIAAWDNPQPVASEIAGFLAELVHDSVAHFNDWPCALHEPRGIYCDDDYYLAGQEQDGSVTV